VRRQIRKPAFSKRWSKATRPRRTCSASGCRKTHFPKPASQTKKPSGNSGHANLSPSHSDVNARSRERPKSAAPPLTDTTGGRPPESLEAHCHQAGWSGKRDSNPRPSAWKADALAAELFPLKPLFSNKMVEGGGFEPPKASPTDLQSVPFDRSGTPPHLREQGIALDAQPWPRSDHDVPAPAGPCPSPAKGTDHC
jgi:hypothetical protein